MSPAYDWRQMIAGIEYADRARMYAPSDREALAAAIRKLRHDGMRPRDISVALRLDLGAVVEALRDVPDSASVIPRIA